MVILCRRLDIDYTDNRNSRETHLFKGGLHLLDTGKRILFNFVFNLNNFLYLILQPILLVGPITLKVIVTNIDQKDELSSFRPLFNRNDAMSENFKNEDMYNTGNIYDPCDTLSILNKLKLKKYKKITYSTCKH